jgi:hypothetical protein
MQPDERAACEAIAEENRRHNPMLARPRFGEFPWVATIVATKDGKVLGFVTLKTVLEASLFMDRDSGFVERGRAIGELRDAGNVAACVSGVEEVYAAACEPTILKFLQRRGMMRDPRTLLIDDVTILRDESYGESRHLAEQAAV